MRVMRVGTFFKVLFQAATDSVEGEKKCNCRKTLSLRQLLINVFQP
jgi:hypothetical protein